MEGGMTGENEDKSLGFKWLKKRGFGGKKNKVQFYESFVYDEVEYTLYDCVYMYKEGYPEPYIGKVVKIWEHVEDKTKKVKVQWFFYMWEILNYLGDKKAQDKEIFIASGEGSGLANINPLEAIAGKCNVVCISKDSRNAQPSDEDIDAADYIFYRTFDVQTCTILDKMDDKIGGLEIQYIFNRNKHEKARTPTLTSERKEGTENATVCDETLRPSSQNPADISITLNTDENKLAARRDSLAGVEPASEAGAKPASGTVKGAGEKAAASADNGKITGKGDSNRDETKVSKGPTIQVKAKERARSAQDSNNLKDQPGKKAKVDNSIKPPHDKDLKEKLPVHEDGVKAPTIQVNVKEGATSAQDIDKLKYQPGKKARGDNDIKPPKDKELKEKLPLHENGANAPTVQVKVKERATSEHDSDNLNTRPGKKARGENLIKPPEGKDLKGKDVHEDGVKSPTIQVTVKEKAQSAQDCGKLKDQLGKKNRGDNLIKPPEGKDLKGKDVHEDSVRTPTIQVKENAQSAQRCDKSNDRPGEKARGDNSIKLSKYNDLKEKVPVRENGVKASVTTSKSEEKLNDLHGKSSPRTGKGVKSVKDDDPEGWPLKKVKVDDSLKLSEDNKNKIQKLSTNNNGSNAKDVKPTDISSEEHKRSRLVLDSLDTKKRSNKEHPDEKVRRLPSGKLPKVSAIESADKNTKAAYQEFEITRRPDTDKSRWFRELPWEERLPKAYEQGTLVLLQNLDPEYTSEEVEGIIWHAFNESCTAKMVQRTAISSPFSGQALVIFKAREATERVMKKLDNGILMLPNGRPLVGSRGPPLYLSGRQSTFSGHLVIDKIKIQNQREMKDAVSTSHCSQPNTIEYEMAMGWCLLQSQSEIWWKMLYEEQKEKLQKLENNLKQK